MKALRLPSFAPEQQPSMLPEEKVCLALHFIFLAFLRIMLCVSDQELMSGLKAEYKLWEDAKSLGSMVHSIVLSTCRNKLNFCALSQLSLRAIENGVFTRRKVGCQPFSLAASASIWIV